MKDILDLIKSVVLGLIVLAIANPWKVVVGVAAAGLMAWPYYWVLYLIPTIYKP